jgi:hypothetical protein
MDPTASAQVKRDGDGARASRDRCANPSPGDSSNDSQNIVLRERSGKRRAPRCAEPIVI